MPVSPPPHPAAVALDTPLVLASSSPYRRALLERFGVPFASATPAVDETRLAGEPPLALVRRLALAKARALAPRYPGALIIGSDQVAVRDNEVLGKPGTEPAAIAQLTAASGRRVRFLTSLCLLDTRHDRYEVEATVTEVRFRQLDAASIAHYVRRERPLDCAGSFKCEGLGITLFEAISADDPTSLVGLPLIALAGMLARAGCDVLHYLP